MNFDMDKSLGFILNRTAFASKNAFNQQIKSYGISPEQWSVIFRVYTQEGISQTEVAKSTYKNQGNLTRMIDKLIVNGFITRTSDEQDRRGVKLFTTPKSVELVENIIPISNAHNQTMSEDLSLEEQEQLITLLNKIYSNLHKG